MPDTGGLPWPQLGSLLAAAGTVNMWWSPCDSVVPCYHMEVGRLLRLWGECILLSHPPGFFCPKCVDSQKLQCTDLVPLVGEEFSLHSKHIYLDDYWNFSLPSLGRTACSLGTHRLPWTRGIRKGGCHPSTADPPAPPEQRSLPGQQELQGQPMPLRF